MQPGESSTAPARRFVLDSFALVAYFEAETGAGRVGELLKQAAAGDCYLYMSMVNLGEILYITERERGLPKAQELLARVNELPIEIIDTDLVHAMAAAHLKANNHIAYVDCFGAALAQLKNSTLLTGDPEFSHISPNSGISIEWLK